MYPFEISTNANSRRSLHESTLFFIFPYSEWIKIKMNEDCREGKFKVAYLFESSASKQLWIKRFHSSVFSHIPSEYGDWWVNPFKSRYLVHGTCYPVMVPVVTLSSLNTGKCWTEKFLFRLSSKWWNDHNVIYSVVHIDRHSDSKQVSNRNELHKTCPNLEFFWFVFTLLIFLFSLNLRKHRPENTPNSGTFYPRKLSTPNSTIKYLG